MGSLKMMDIDQIPSDLKFSIFSGAEVRQMSVVKIITGLTFDALGHPLPGGLYDSAMGSHGRGLNPCSTCFNMQACPGHIGNIELSMLVYNPFFTKLVQRIMGIFCLHCSKVQLKEHVLLILMLQLRLINAGYFVEAQKLEIYKSEVVQQNDEDLVKTEDGDFVHPYIASMMELLANAKASGEPLSQNTKSICGARTAVVNAALQRPTHNKCIECHKPLRYIRYLHRRLVYYLRVADIKDMHPDIENTTGQNKMIFADECRKMLRTIYSNYSELLLLLFPILKLAPSCGKSNAADSPFDMMFMDTVVVTPPKARPCNVLHSRIEEHPKTGIYRAILDSDAVMRVIMRHLKGDLASTDETVVYDGVKGTSPHDKFYHAWQALQTAVDMLLDVNNIRDMVGTNGDGLKQVLEKKNGLIRKHMMGKRVNYAARTVITPDPNINVDEVGIPDVFARKLTYPVPVTPWNVAELRKMVMNGPNIHPGANYIEDEKGYTKVIPGNNAAKRESMAKLLFSYPENGIKVVHRHLINGDPLLLNRQPSLHKPSLMAHRSRILAGEKTIRMHYSNCKAYNADFDGDEMNAHYPQNEVARSEAVHLVNVANNYLVPKDGTPLGGLIQDHVISGVKLTMRGRFFNREDYHQLVYQGLAHMPGNIKLLPPAILKPMRLWSGKQIISTLIINLIPDGYPRINLRSVSKITSMQWNVEKPRVAACGNLTNPDIMSEYVVTIQGGELLTGVLDKQQYGATKFGLIHCMYELYGGGVSTSLLTALTKVFTTFLQREGFTLGVKDILLTAETENQRRQIIRECRLVGNAAVAAALELPEVPELDVLADHLEEAYIKDDNFRVVLDRRYKSALDAYTNDINRACLPYGLISHFPANNLQLMVAGGAKGSMVNTMQMSCLLGQIELEGKRPPLMISGKALPSFTSFETSPKAGGFIDGRFMTGIQPQDFFFHCMAGREGLIDTAVKTSRSGYLQRCLIKHLEGLNVHYDMTVRDSDNTVVQFLYGEDGVDVLKSSFFNKNFAVDFLAHNPAAILRPNELAQIKDAEQLAVIARHTKKLRSWHKKHKSATASKRLPSVFAQFSAELRDEVVVDRPNELNPKTGRRRYDESIVKLWLSADADSKEQYRKRFARCPDPTTSLYQQDCFYGSVSETVEALIAGDNKHPRDAKRKAIIADILYVKNMKSLAAPGEPVGLLAAQSIGEPSTQMTLNTFHFAGRGEMNVTLGIPRLREILMLASANIKTPSMDIPIKAGQDRAADKLRISLNRVTLSDLLHYLNVNVKLVLQPQRAYQYQLHFQFLPRLAYQNQYGVRPKRVLRYMSEVFFKELFRAIIKTSKSQKCNVDLGDAKSAKDQKAGGDADADDDDEDGGQGSERGGGSSAKRNEKGAGGDTDSSDDEGAANDEDDATAIRLKARKQDDEDYDDPDEAEEIKDANDEEDDEPMDEGPKDDDDEAEDKAAAAAADEIVETVLNNEMVDSYVYDKEAYLWCKLTFNLSVKYRKPDITSVVRQVASKCVVHQVPHINRAIIYTGDNNVKLLKTDGINIVEMFAHNTQLDLNRLYSNDIHAIARTYGIEAAAQVIIREVTNVFKVYGIAVDRRHLSLIADYMTFDGTFMPLSRTGMTNSASPLQQMSFESAMHFLQNATIYGRSDSLHSPSSRLIVGLPVRSGTGAFDLITKIC